MKLSRFRLPVSRRRHEAKLRARVRKLEASLSELQRQRDEAGGETVEMAGALRTAERTRDEAREAFYCVKAERDEERARRIKLEQAIREHRRRRNASDVRNPYPQDDAKLWSVLDGHDRQELGRCNQHLGSETHGGPEQYCAAPRGHDGHCLDYVGAVEADREPRRRA